MYFKSRFLYIRMLAQTCLIRCRTMTLNWIVFGAVVTWLLPLADCLIPNFQRVTFLNDGADLCALDTPSASVDIEYIERQFPMLFEIPSEVHCAFFRVSTSDAAFASYVGINYRDDVKRCEYFSRLPTNCGRERGCSHFSVSWQNVLFIRLKAIHGQIEQMLLNQQLQLWNVQSDEISYSIIRTMAFDK